jgi:hypothetical protein
MQFFKHILIIIKIRVIDMVAQGQPLEICIIPGYEAPSWSKTQGTTLDASGVTTRDF